MPRGGARKGAGRPPGPTLDYPTQLSVGGRCETLWWEACQRNEKDAVERFEQTIAPVRRLQEKANAIPVSERGAWLEEQNRLGARKRDGGDSYFGDVRGELKAIQGHPPDSTKEPNRLVTILIKRPKGHRATIIKQVAEEFGVSERMVKTCWQEFRRFKKEV